MMEANSFSLFAGEDLFFKEDIISGSGLRAIEDIINPSYSKSTLANMERSERFFVEFANKHKAGDPYTVSVQSSQLIMDCLVEKCRYNTIKEMKVDTMGGCVQQLRLVYQKYGHNANWMVNRETKTATGKRLERNPHFDQFWRA
ncbi:hypothetical protein BWQ96_04831 [Gracilariopsis chorda]|uniref:Uncharacterized protein n=1 Tax=Gracilariopsis chorda TaxID=448386 RepID=A0A2V3ITG5_9FLOR|nr:hypothetical protein BWQ96_04831 [Gracilariopsis chorda]|eukprot:PXF45416.1 hypothetical protein BWQ96_04831 [Gracilariopsis chorda]